MAEIAPSLRAMVVFAESAPPLFPPPDPPRAPWLLSHPRLACRHRYYGSSWQNGSWPFGASSFDRDKIPFLTVEQALADFADNIRLIKAQWSAPNTAAVITFGGSCATHPDTSKPPDPRPILRAFIDVTFAVTARTSQCGCA